jgi:hypothetical protein
LGDQIEKNEVDRECSTYEREQRRKQGIWWGILRKNDTVEDKKMDIQEVGCGE